MASFGLKIVYVQRSFNGRPGHHLPIGRKSKTCFEYLMSSILLTWPKHSCLYCANFFSTGSTLCYSKISSVLLRSNKLNPAVRHMNFISAVFLFQFPCKFYVIAKILYTFNPYFLWNKFGSKTFFRSPKMCKCVLIF